MDAVRFERRGGVAMVTLDRPADGNAIDVALSAAALDAFTRCAEPDVRAVLLRAEGKLFCGGGDVRALGGAADLQGILRELTTVWHEALRALAAVPVPVVAAVQGAAAGAGLGLVGLADVVLAAERARFSFAYDRVGLTPDGGVSAVLPRLVGERRAAELAFTGRVLTAAEARDWGLVTTVVPDADLAAGAVDLADRIAAGPTAAYAAAKRLLRESRDRTYSGQLDEESRTMTRIGATADARAGLAAFLAGERPGFAGR